MSRCRKCKRFVGNSNCSTAGSIADGDRGLLICDKCLKQQEKIEMEKHTRQAQGRPMRSKKNELNLRCTNTAGLDKKCEELKAQYPNIPAPDIYAAIVLNGIKTIKRKGLSI